MIDIWELISRIGIGNHNWSLISRISVLYWEFGSRIIIGNGRLGISGGLDWDLVTRFGNIKHG